MKNLITLLLTLGFISSSAQSIWIADNNPSAPTGTNIFSTIQAAVNAAAPGDTIFIQPSTTTYGTATSNIELHFRGIGFNLDKDVPYTSDVTTINLHGAVDGSSDPSSSSITGLSIGLLNLGRASSGDPSYTLSGLRIYNNNITTLSYADAAAVVPIDDLLLAYNYLNTIHFNDSVTSSIIRNNVIDASLNFNSSAAITSTVTNNIINGHVLKRSIDDFLVVQNNNFIGNGSFNIAFATQMENAIVSNNIFYGTTPSIVSAGSTSPNFENNVFNNNISFSAPNNDLPPTGGPDGNSGGGNLPNLDPQFASATLGSNWISSDDYTTSAAEVTNGGTDVSDIGIFGGPYPFATTNLQLATSSIPTIQSLNISTIINPGQPLQVDVSAKSN